MECPSGAAVSVTQVRFGKHVYAPLAQAGEVDVLIALEELEALRYASYLKKMEFC